MDCKLSFSSHITSISKKAYIKSSLISRCFLSKNPKLLTSAYTSYVRPILEYAVSVWSPHLSKNITILEKVQRRFTKSIPNLRFLPYQTRLSRLNLLTLSLRRSHTDLHICYRILHNLIHLDSNLFFTLRANNITRGHHFTLTKPSVRLNSAKFSFYSRVVDVWNALPLTIVSATSLPIFKYQVRTALILVPD
jgi:hypothetical protein